MPEACQSCAALQAQIAYLQGEIARLNYRLSETVGGVLSTAGWIEREMNKATMARQNTLPYLVERLYDVAGSPR